MASERVCRVLPVESVRLRILTLPLLLLLIVKMGWSLLLNSSFLIPEINSNVGRMVIIIHIEILLGISIVSVIIVITVHSVS